MVRGGGGGDYLRKTIILNFSIKEGWGDYLREAINRGTAIIQGNRVCTEQCIRLHTDVVSNYLSDRRQNNFSTVRERLNASSFAILKGLHEFSPLFIVNSLF